jgi:hypothetical protein
MNKKVTVLFAIIIFLGTTFLSYTFFSQQSSAQHAAPGSSLLSAGKIDNDYEAITFDENAPKTEACPLNGALYSKDQRKWWESHRPLGVMIENHQDARPQSGISFADVVYEAVAEGGITRTLSIFYCRDAGIVGPVRSARTYFLDFISEYGKNPLYTHVGGANSAGPANALGQITDYGWSQYNDLSQFSIGFPTFKRDESRLGHDVATEHTMYSVTNKLWDVGKTRGLTRVDKNGKAWEDNFVKYSFKEDASTSKRPDTASIHINFWDDENYSVDWTYDKAKNLYLRKNGGAAHMDRNTHKQITTKNIVVLFMKESHANDGYENNAHMLYGTTGTGKMSVFMDGKEIKGTWKKEDREGRTQLFDDSGKEIKFNRGVIWFEIQPIGATVITK